VQGASGDDRGRAVAVFVLREEPQHEVRTLLGGPTVYICDECVALSVDVLIDRGYPSSWLLGTVWRAWFRRLHRWVAGEPGRSTWDP
jgi:hypothetical protein